MIIFQLVHNFCIFLWKLCIGHYFTKGTHRYLIFSKICWKVGLHNLHKGVNYDYIHGTVKIQLLWKDKLYYYYRRLWFFDKMTNETQDAEDWQSLHQNTVVIRADEQCNYQIGPKIINFKLHLFRTPVLQMCVIWKYEILTCKPLMPASLILSRSSGSLSLLWHMEENLDTKKS